MALISAGIQILSSTEAIWVSCRRIPRVKEGVSKAEAEEIKAKLEAEGAEVNLK